MGTRNTADLPVNRNSPSAYRHRLPVAIFALVGSLLSVYLALFQLQVLHAVWDPLFHAQSRIVLGSPLSQALPLPDALIGAIAYLVEFVAVLIGGVDRYRTKPGAVLVYSLVAYAMGAAAFFLFGYQLYALHALCTLCLASALLSIALVFPAIRESRAVFRYRRPSQAIAPPNVPPNVPKEESYAKHAA